jgi:hypothetical protein
VIRLTNAQRVCLCHAKQDEAHLKLMRETRELVQNPGAMKSWVANKKKEFDALPEG